jgi:hypothetical protein
MHILIESVAGAGPGYPAGSHPGRQTHKFRPITAYQGNIQAVFPRKNICGGKSMFQPPILHKHFAIQIPVDEF